MTLNRELIGKTYPVMQYTLSPAAAAGYARATADHNPRYGEEGWQATAQSARQWVAPPMSVVMASIPFGVGHVAGDTDLIGDPVRLLHMLHGGEDIRWHHPLQPGQTFDVVSRVHAIDDKGSGELLTVHTSLFDAQKVCVTESFSGLFFRHPKGSGLKKDDAARMVEQNPTRAPDFNVPWTVAADQSERYAAVSGDFNPIHLDDDVARSAGLKARILHGLCTMAYAGRVVVDELLQGDCTRLARLSVRFSRPVYMGDTLTCSGWRNDNQVRLDVRNQDGKVVMSESVAELR